LPPKPVILAFDTAAAHCAAVVVQGDKVLATQVEILSKGQAERLFPLIEDVLTKAEVTWSDLTAIAVGTGPGNFTGIRISVSAARGLALSLKIPSIGVSRLEAMAFGQSGPITAIIDARQSRIYAQDFLNGAQTSDVRLIGIDEFVPKNSTICDADVAVPATALPTERALANAAQIAAGHLDTEQPKPAPLYVRAPDAAFPSDLPPTILP
jgi:tRNA threonylcarbamoyl adenosine modification protein YeaZ